MISKSEGGKYFSNKHNVTTTTFCNSSNVGTSTTLLQRALKKELNLQKEFVTCFGKIYRNETGNNCCINVCITFKLWWTWRYFQYSRSKNMNFFFQQFVLLTLDLPRLHFFFLHELQMTLIFLRISSPLNICGDGLNSCSPLNAFFCFLNGWLHGRNRLCPCIWVLFSMFQSTRICFFPAYWTTKISF